MIFELKRDSHLPLYEQIATQVREMIGRGALKVGDRLPPNRELARALGVNRGTVTTAYDELTADGLISSHVGRGTFVSAVPAPRRRASSTREDDAPAPPPMPWSALLAGQQRDEWSSAASRSGRDEISFAYSLPSPEIFPLDEFRRGVDRVLRREGRALIHLGAPGGYEPLQQYIAAQMALSGIRVTADEILITSGCQQAIDLIHRMLVRPGDEIAIESPTYPGAIGVLCGATSKYTSIPFNAHGLDLNVLEDVFAQRRPKLLYTVPSYHNPTGVTMDLAARRRLIELAARYRVPIIEDDIYRELRYSGAAIPPLKALDPYGLVIYLNSFSKIGFPGLRVGWIAAPRIVIEHLNSVKQRCDLHASLLAQAAIHEFARGGLLVRHISRSRKAYAERRDCLLASLARHFPAEAEWNEPDGGMAVWVRLPASLSARSLLLAASEQGVIFSPGESFYPCAAPPDRLRLSFATLSPAQIEEGIKRLGALVKARLTGVRRHRAMPRPEPCRALV